MTTEAERVHIIFFPLMAQGHMLPTLDLARLIAARGVSSTIITAPLNAPLFSKTIHKTHNSQATGTISLRIVDFRRNRPASLRASKISTQSPDWTLTGSSSPLLFSGDPSMKLSASYALTA